MAADCVSPTNLVFGYSLAAALYSLKTYSTSIGISHYLVNRLRSFEYEDVEFYWPQLWSVSKPTLHAPDMPLLIVHADPHSSDSYLVITRTTPSNALENFILERCQDDSHIAVIVRSTRHYCVDDARS